MLIYYKTFIKVLKILNKKQKLNFFLVQLLILLTSFVDVLGLASFIPVVSAIADPEILESNKVFLLLKRMIGVKENDAFLFYLFSGAVVFFLIRSMFLVLSNWLQNKYVFGLSEFIGVKTYEYYMNSNYESFQKRDSSQVIRELTVNTQQFSRLLILSLLTLSSEIVIVSTIVIGIAAYNFEVFILLAFTVFPVAVLFNFLVKKKMRRFGLEQNELTPILYSQSSRGMMGFVDVKLRSKESSLISDYRNTLKKLIKINIISSVLNILPAKLFELVTVFGLFVLFIYSVYLADDSALMLPLLVLYAASGYRLIPSLGKILPSFMVLERNQFLFDVFRDSIVSPKKEPDTKFENIQFAKEICFADLSFVYLGADKEVLNKANYTIQKGDVVGLVGVSGSGKTTLAHLLAGFLRPTAGEIKIDGKVLKEKHLKNWRSKISYVQQSPYLEKGSMASNIAFLEETINQSKLNKAIKLSCLDGFVGSSDPDDVFVDEFGKNLSGGQKQRVAIARALYHNAELIILDEATSALDNETELAIIETIDRLKGTGITILIIAHRLSTLKNVDYTLKVENQLLHKVV